MAANTRKEAAKRFAAYWSERRGSEKGEDQTFWNSLLSEVLGVSDVKSRIRYQDPVHYKGTTKFLDAWIPETQVLIDGCQQCDAHRSRRNALPLRRLDLICAYGVDADGVRAVEIRLSLFRRDCL